MRFSMYVILSILLSVVFYVCDYINILLGRVQTKERKKSIR